MEKPEIEIVPVKIVSFNFRELWKNRELLFFFTWRDIKVKYKQTLLGILWALLQPLFMMLIFYFVFSRAIKVDVGNVSYPVYAFCGLLLWGLFFSGVSQSSESMLSNANIIRKIYFPRLLIPLSSLIVALIDFCFGFILLLALFIFFRQPVSWSALYCFPLAVMMTLGCAFGIGIFMAALNVKYRDFRYVLPFLLQLLFFGSQIIYSIDHIEPGWLKYLLYCNPFNGALELFKYPLQAGEFNAKGFYISSGFLCLFLISGLIYFRKTEAFFADLI